MLNHALKAGAPRLIKGAQSALVSNKGKLSQLKIRKDQPINLSSSKPEIIRQVQSEMAMEGSTSGWNITKDGIPVQAKHKGTKGITNTENVTEIRFAKKSTKKKERNLRKSREKYDEKAVRSALNDLDAYDPDTFVALREVNKRKIKDLENEIARKNKEAGKIKYSLGHIVALENGGLHVRENMTIEPYRSKDGVKGNGARSSTEDIQDMEAIQAIGVPTGKNQAESWKIWVAMQLWPELKGFASSGELEGSDILDIMNGLHWETALQKRQMFNSKSTTAKYK
jgi:hypothetical protein